MHKTRSLPGTSPWREVSVQMCSLGCDGQPTGGIGPCIDTFPNPTTGGIVACVTALGHDAFTAQHVPQRCDGTCGQMDRLVGLPPDPQKVERAEQLSAAPRSPLNA